MASAADAPPAHRPRIGLFGGTFDPPHLGHCRVAADVADALDLDQVLWIPAGSPYHRRDVSVSPAADRRDMVCAAAVSDPRFVVDEIEIDRPGASYTIDTVRSLRERDPAADFFLIVGVDQYATFASWREPAAILALVTLVVMDRDGRDATALVPLVSGVEGVLFVPVARVDISSTQVRRRVQAGLDLEGWVPQAVADIVCERGLYRIGDRPARISVAQ